MSNKILYKINLSDLFYVGIVAAMSKNQLFRQIPPIHTCERVLHAFGLKNFTDPTFFSRKDLAAIRCVDSMRALKDELSLYYLPCKARTYLNELNTKNIITILRQLCRLYNYSVQSREKYIKGDKFIIYQIIPSDNQKYQPMTIHQGGESCTVVFD
jgi:hypothetical protein